MIRAVLDTNCLVSALLKPDGREAIFLLAVHEGLLAPCLSEAILAEYAAVLARPKFGFPSDDIARLMAMLRHRGEVIAPAPSGFASPDHGDTKFIDCAVAARAACIVTGNRRHFPDAPYGAVEVIGSGELLDRLALEA